MNKISLLFCFIIVVFLKLPFSFAQEESTIYGIEVNNIRTPNIKSYSSVVEVDDS
jgi:hypothetical protein